MSKLSTCIIGGKIILEDQVLMDKVLIFDDKIADIMAIDDFNLLQSGQDLNIIDAHGDFISPGFIDLHIHGAAGHDTMDGTIPGLQAIGEAIAQNGVTGFLPTTMTMKKPKIYQALDAIAAAMKVEGPGARILGAHMEGPFLSPVYSGAHNKADFLKPDMHLISDYLETIKMITIAPEEDPSFLFIKEVSATTDIVLAMGHTNADYDTAMKAVEMGIRNATHLFNAMAPFHHRAPGPVGAVLNSQISFELIADTVHIHPALFQFLLNEKGKEKMILVTDSMRAAGLGTGTWELGGQKVFADGVSAKLADGTLAGSVLGLNVAVRNILQHTNLEIYEAVRLASMNPAKLIRLDKTKGSIAIGKDADLILFDDNLNIQQTILEGRVIYSGPDVEDA